jgi:hypothetical protein
MLYRIHNDLLVNADKGEFIRGCEGCVSCLDGIGKDKIAILLKVQAISLVQAPPLSVFPGWKTRAERLTQASIDTVRFLEMEAKDIVKTATDATMKDWRVDLVEEWQEEVKARLGIGHMSVAET